MKLVRSFCFEIASLQYQLATKSDLLCLCKIKGTWESRLTLSAWNSQHLKAESIFETRMTVILIRWTNFEKHPCSKFEQPSVGSPKAQFLNVPPLQVSSQLDSIPQGGSQLKIWLLLIYGGFPKLGVPFWGSLFGGPYNKDYSILGSIFGSPYLGETTICQ